MRQHTSAYVRIRFACGSSSCIRTCLLRFAYVSKHDSGYVRIRQDTSGYVDERACCDLHVALTYADAC
jgi:hypothetical protein